MAEQSSENFSWTFLRKLWNALLRMAGLAVLIEGHRLLAYLLEVGTPVSLHKGSLFLQAVSYVVFALIYCYLLWDILTIFIPQFIPNPYPGTESGSTE